MYMGECDLKWIFMQLISVAPWSFEQSHSLAYTYFVGMCIASYIGFYPAVLYILECTYSHLSCIQLHNGENAFGETDKRVRAQNGMTLVLFLGTALCGGGSDCGTDVIDRCVYGM